MARIEKLKAIEYKERKREASLQQPISGRSAVLPETAGGSSARHSFFFQVTNDFFVTNEFVAIYIEWKKTVVSCRWQYVINMCSNFNRK